MITSFNPCHVFLAGVQTLLPPAVNIGLMTVALNAIQSIGAQADSTKHATNFDIFERLWV